MSAQQHRFNNILILVVIGGMVLFGRFWIAADQVTYVPEPGPRPACETISSEMLAAVVPGGKPVQSSGLTREGFHITTCDAETGQAKLSVNLIRVGRSNGMSAEANLEPRPAFARAEHVKLGNDAWLSEGTLQIRQGSYFVWIDYITKDSADPEAKRRAVLALGQEVLSKL